MNSLTLSNFKNGQDTTKNLVEAERSIDKPITLW